MKNIISISFPFESREDFEESQKRIIREIIEEKFSGIDKTNKNPEYLTRKQVATKLHISLVTLNELTKSGVLQGYRLQGRVLYKWSEVEQALRRIETKKNRRGQL